VPKNQQPEYLTVVVGDGGWMRIALRDIEAGPIAKLDERWLGASVLARAAATNDHVGIAELHLYRETGEPLTGEALRSFPLPLLERVLNGPELADAIAVSIKRGHRGRPENAVPTPPPDEPGRPVSVHGFVYDNGVTAFLFLLPREDDDLKLPTLGAKAGRKRPDDFYRRVADVFSRAAGPRPAIRIAEANGVPPSTVHRWVKEARRRGVMPGGRTGTARSDADTEEQR
jgi:hypothetical protein